jgi:aspartate/methionine/tyrosine aminotransferase
MRLAARAERIRPFYVMEMAKAAAEVARSAAHGGRPMIYLNIGEPDFGAPPLVQEAAVRAIHDGRTQYTQATGLWPLRERISDWYQARLGVAVPPERIIITAGASAALQMACLALVEAGDRVLMPDPCYPCNQQFVHAADGEAVLVPSGAQQRFQLDAEWVREAWARDPFRSRGVLLASPSNPTGTSIDPQELGRIHAHVRERDGFTIVDEIYLGLSHDPVYGHSALALDDQIISINSFSKYFCMTGWRLGWLVVPQELVSVVERIAQHLFICPSTVAQHAAMACFEPASLAEYERRRAEFRARRDYLVPALQAVGLDVPVMPDGAFYVWADCRRAAARLGLPDSWAFAHAVMQQAHVALTPGRDFGHAQTASFVRLSSASALPDLQAAVARLAELLR